MPVRMKMSASMSSVRSPQILQNAFTSSYRRRAVKGEMYTSSSVHCGLPRNFLNGRFSQADFQGNMTEGLCFLSFVAAVCFFFLIFAQAKTNNTS